MRVVAGVAELADARDLGSRVLRDLQVRFLSPALLHRVIADLNIRRTIGRDTIRRHGNPMTAINSIQGLRISRAYGLPVPASSPIARIEPGSSSRVVAAPSTRVQNLVGAVVPGRIAFDSATGAPVHAQNPIPFYRSPADRNAAAVSIEIGRSIDIQG